MIKTMLALDPLTAAPNSPRNQFRKCNNCLQGERAQQYFLTRTSITSNFLQKPLCTRLDLHASTVVSPFAKPVAAALIPSYGTVNASSQNTACLLARHSHRHYKVLLFGAGHAASCIPKHWSTQDATPVQWERHNSVFVGCAIYTTKILGENMSTQITIRSLCWSYSWFEIGNLLIKGSFARRDVKTVRALESVIKKLLY